MRTLILLTCFVLVCFFGNFESFADVYFDDGESHIVNDERYNDENVFLDYYTANLPGTSLELQDNAYVRNVFLKNNATLNVNGYNGVSDYVIAEYVNAYDNSTVNLIEGYIGQARFHNETVVNTSANNSYIGYMEAYDNVVINSANAGADHYYLHDDSISNISSGWYGETKLYHNSSLNVSGGYLQEVFAYDNTSIDVSGGSVNSVL